MLVKSEKIISFQLNHAPLVSELRQVSNETSLFIFPMYMMLFAHDSLGEKKARSDNYCVESSADSVEGT